MSKNCDAFFCTDRRTEPDPIYPRAVGPRHGSAADMSSKPGVTLVLSQFHQFRTEFVYTGVDPYSNSGVEIEADTAK